MTIKSLVLMSICFGIFVNTFASDHSKHAIVIGASSGIGRELAKVLSENNYVVGITGRRTAMLNSLQTELPNKSYVQTMDVAQHEKAIQQLSDLIDRMGGVELVIISAGVTFHDPDLDWQKEKQMIDVNVSGFTAIASTALNYFIVQKHGHLVGISSIGALRGHRYSPVYNATKAYESLFMEGLRDKVRGIGLPITVTDIQPGFVQTGMTKGVEGMFWQASAQEAAQQIYDAIEAKSDHAYVTKRWWIIAWSMKYIPDWLYRLFDR